MKILLTAINAKYIHSNLAVYSLRAFAAAVLPQYAAETEIAEYTINQTADQILIDIYRQNPDVICFSCYLWNIDYVRRLLAELPKILPLTEIWLGGPEVSYHAEDMLLRNPQVKGIMCGEGEETFADLVRYYHGLIDDLGTIAGICFRADSQTADRGKHALRSAPAACDGGLLQDTVLFAENDIRTTAPRPVMDLSRVPFVYKDIDIFRNRIIYYESSRGCPFSCSYCLSSVDKCLRFRSLDLVREELRFFIDHEVPQVKFVDRTFNCRHDHAMAVWSYLKEHDKGITNFHFEVAADLLNEEELALISSMRPGLIQLEIGVQSTNPQTIREIRRSMRFEQVVSTVSRIRAAGNIHQHLDLIAGLPYEDYDSFQSSFNDVYALRPHQLQLGFLKVLKGSYMEEKTAEYELRYQSAPPYEVLSTKWLSYTDIIRLKGIEEMVEVYYNSGQFIHTMELTEHLFPDAFTMFESLSRYYELHDYYKINHTRIARYEILWGFIIEKIHSLTEEQTRQLLYRSADRQILKKHPAGETFPAEDISGDAAAGNLLDEDILRIYRETLTLDLYLRENVKNRPPFAGEETVGKEDAMRFYDAEAEGHHYLRGYEGYDKRQLRKMTHLERVGGKLLLFDYKNRDILTNQAAVYEIID